MRQSLQQPSFNLFQKKDIGDRCIYFLRIELISYFGYKDSIKPKMKCSYIFGQGTFERPKIRDSYASTKSSSTIK